MRLVAPGQPTSSGPPHQPLEAVPLYVSHADAGAGQPGVLGLQGSKLGIPSGHSDFLAGLACLVGVGGGGQKQLHSQGGLRDE